MLAGQKIYVTFSFKIAIEIEQLFMSLSLLRRNLWLFFYLDFLWGLKASLRNVCQAWLVLEWVTT